MAITPRKNAGRTQASINKDRSIANRAQSLENKKQSIANIPEGPLRDAAARKWSDQKSKVDRAKSNLGELRTPTAISRKLDEGIAKTRAKTTGTYPPPTDKAKTKPAPSTAWRNEPSQAERMSAAERDRVAKLKKGGR